MAKYAKLWTEAHIAQLVLPLPTPLVINFNFCIVFVVLLSLEGHF